jgi:AraC-like DNA-binding protein
VSAARPQFLFPGDAQFGEANLILHARSRRHTARDFAGPLSIKTVVQGTVAWKVRGRDLIVEPGSFLVLGDGERYSMQIDAPQAVETACAFFRGGFVEEAARDATTPLQSLFDRPQHDAPALLWLSRLHHDRDSAIADRVQTMARRCQIEILPSSVEEDFLLLARDLLLLYRRVSSQIAKLPAVRRATREELFRRVESGREYLHGHAEGAVSLDTVARAACLSRYHFHRAFTQLIGQSPHVYLTDLRLGRAREVLRSGAPVAEACLAAGFTSVPSFCRLFRRRYGIAPGKLGTKIGPG